MTIESKLFATPDHLPGLKLVANKLYDEPGCADLYAWVLELIQQASIPIPKISVPVSNFNPEPMGMHFGVLGELMRKGEVEYVSGGISIKPSGDTVRIHGDITLKVSQEGCREANKRLAP